MTNASARTYVVASDLAVLTNELVVRVNVYAEQTGSGTSVHVGEGSAQLDDPLWDPSWQVVELSCDDGTAFEKASDYRTRLRAAQLRRRVGYAKAMSDACVRAGAAHVALFASDYGGEEHDCGLNVCYVAEEGYTTSERLINACTVTLERVRVAGADLQVLPMRREELKIEAEVTLWDDPGVFDQLGIERAIRASLLAEFDGPDRGYEFRVYGLQGAAIAGSDAIQDAQISYPLIDGTVLVGNPPNFPAVLTRYALAERDIHLSLRGPK